MLIADGCGILAIPKEQINNFETLLLDFYETNKPDKFFSFLTKEAIYGLDRTVPSSQNLKVKPSKPSRAERKAEKKKAKEEAKAAKAQKKAAGRRGATSPNAPSLTGMEKIAVKVSRLQKVTAGLAVIAVLAGGVAVVSEIDANNRIAEAFSGTTEVVAATKTIHAGDEISASDLAFVSVPNSTVECIILTVNNDFMDAGGYAHEQLQ